MKLFPNLQNTCFSFAKYIVIAIFLLQAVFCMAKQVTIEESLIIAQQFYSERLTSKISKLKSATIAEFKLDYISTDAPKALNGRALAPAATDNTAYFYVYNIGDKQGFIIVSGDDRITPILGYSDEGAFTYENIPEHVKAFMDNYKNQVKAIMQRNDTTAAQKPMKVAKSVTAVTPLTTTKWGHSAPFNCKIPITAPTGCATTTMAQIMKYHNWPISGKGWFGYDYPEDPLVIIGGSSTYDFSANFGKTVYDWNNMLNSYYFDRDTSSIKVKAVATLMYHCGVSMKTSFSKTSSGAYTASIPYALVNYFGYDKGIQYFTHQIYSDIEWKDIIINELDNKRPAILTGFCDTIGGHAYIADGYDNEKLIHINWGWEGVNDGYYEISTLDSIPNNTWFNQGQGIIIGIQKNKSITNYSLTYRDLSIEYPEKLYSKDSIIRIVYKVIESNGKLFEGSTGIGLYQKDSLCSVFAPTSTIINKGSDWNLNSGDANGEVSKITSDFFPKSIANGTYQLIPVFKSITDSIWIKANYLSGIVNTSNVENTEIEVSDLGVAFYPNSMTLSCNNPGELSSKIYNAKLNRLVVSGNIDQNDILDIAESSIKSINLGETNILQTDMFFSPVNIQILGQHGLLWKVSVDSNTIARGIFANSSSENIVLPKNLKSFKPSGFYKCLNLSKIIIPDSIKIISDSLFYGCEKLSDISLPDGLLSIGDRSFTLCKNLKSIVLPSKVTSIGHEAFYNCIGLTEIFSFNPIPPKCGYDVFYNVPSNITVHVPVGSLNAYKSSYYWWGFTNIIADLPVNYCSKTINNPISGKLSTHFTNSEKAIINNLTITGNLNKEDFTFIRDSLISVWYLNISKVSLLSNKIPEKAFFKNKTDLKVVLSNIILPESLLIIGDSAFKNCSFLKNISFPSTLFDIGIGAFEGCSSITEFKQNYGVSSFSINNGILYNKDVSSVILYPPGKQDSIFTVPTTVTSIARSAFGSCNNLTAVNLACLLYSYTNSKLSEKVTSIGDYAFRGCNKIKSIVLPTTVTSVGNGAFDDCSNLTKIISNNPTPPVISGHITFPLMSKDVFVKVPVGTVEKYRTALGWKDLTNINDVAITKTVINNSAGNLSTRLTADEIATVNQLIITGNLNTADYSYLKHYLPLLNQIDISGTVLTTIEPSAFSYFENLTSVKLPLSITSIGKNAFYYCSKITTIDLPSALNTIGDEAFRACTGLTSITLPTAITTIGSNVFYSCPSLKVIKVMSLIPINLTSSYVFNSVDFNSCILQIPVGTKSAYQAAAQWKDFKCMVEGEYSSTKTINVSAGKLSSALTSIDLMTVSNLTVIGTIDARDFVVLRDSMVNLSILDISNVEIVSYKGIGGTAGVTDINYPPKTIPLYAFYNISTYKGKQTLTSIILPLTATSIGSSAFERCIGLMSINIPTSITTIGSLAFWDCSNLKFLNMPSSISSIGSNSFSYCQSLTTIDIPSSVTSIGSGAFNSCSNLKSIIIPSSVASIGSTAFQYCLGLTSIYVNSNPIDLSSSSTVFGSVNKAACTLYVPYKAKVLFTIANQWKDFTNIVESQQGFLLDSNSVKLPSTAGNTTLNITSNVKWTASSDQTWLTVSPDMGTGDNMLTLTVQSNPTSAFRIAKVTVLSTEIASQTITITQLGSPKSINLTPGGLSSALTSTELEGIIELTITGTIDARDFKTMRDNMPALAKLDLSGVNIVGYTGTEGTYSDFGKSSTLFTYLENVIPDQAFVNGSTGSKISLTSVIMPLSITSIGNAAFYGCLGLTSIIIPNSVTSIGGSTFYGCKGISNIIIPNTVNSLGNSAFAGCSGLTSINIPSSVTSISSSVFYSCIGLTSISIPSTITSIGNSAFAGCTGLTSIIIPNAVTSIGNLAFQSCNGLTTINIPSSVAFIGSGIFQSCIGLTSICIPSSITSIESYAFGYCYNLKSVTIPSSVTSIGSSAFYSCGLTSIDIPSSVTTIGGSAFGDCNKLESVTIPSSVTSIGSSAFYNCTSLTDVNIPSSIKNIESSTFKNCEGLTSIVIPSSVISIGTSAFDYCLKLKSVTIPSSVTSIGNLAFNNCVCLTSINIPSSVTFIGTWAFKSCIGLKSIYVNSNPIDLSSTSEVFPKTSYDGGRSWELFSTLYVPYKSKVLYLAANQWKEFKNIVENTQGFLLSSSTAALSSTAGGTTVNVIANVSWDASSDQTWLTVSPSAGIGDNTFTLSAQANSKATTRTAIVTVSSTGITSQTITVTQGGLPKSINIIAGGLSTSLSPSELLEISDLTVTGNIDARDFKTMRDNMPLLSKLDLSGAAIEEYTGSEGTSSNVSTLYPKNAIPQKAFYNPNSSIGKKGLINVDLPLTSTKIGESAFYSCSDLKSVTIPTSVTLIGGSAFCLCSSLSSVLIPNSTISIDSYAFYGCYALNTIYSYSTTPVDLYSSTFDYVNKYTCTLYVPKGSKSAYQAAYRWQDFTNIVEMKDFALSTNAVKMAINGNPVSVSVTSNTTWIVSSEQSWLTASPTSGSGDGTLTLTATPHAGYFRTAKVTVTPTDAMPQTITVMQGGWCTKSITVNAGGLSTSLTSSELVETTDLTISGTIDARDFKTMRDDMPFLEKLDLSGVNVLAYTGTDGTDVAGVSKTYQVNSIPQNAFYNANTNTGKISLISVLMPSSVTSIGNFAFYLCKGLASVNITSAISSMGSFSFGNCAGLNEINVEPGNSNYSAIDGVLFDKNQTKLIQYPNNKQSNNYVVPSSITSIEEFAFYFCSGLSSITIPNTVTSIGKFAFASCSGLKSIYAYSTTPVDLSSSIYIFSGLESTCTLYVPKGSLSAYQAANQWEDFDNIVEMDISDLSINTIENINLYPNPATTTFRITGFEGLVTCKILDLNGRLLLNKQVTENESVLINSLPKGLYIVKIITVEGTVERKLIMK